MGSRMDAPFFIMAIFGFTLLHRMVIMLSGKTTIASVFPSV